MTESIFSHSIQIGQRIQNKINQLNKTCCIHTNIYIYTSSQSKQIMYQQHLNIQEISETSHAQFVLYIFSNFRNFNDDSLHPFYNTTKYWNGNVDRFFFLWVGWGVNEKLNVLCLNIYRMKSLFWLAVNLKHMTEDDIIHVNPLRFILNREMRTHTSKNPIRFEQFHISKSDIQFIAMGMEGRYKKP